MVAVEDCGSVINPLIVDGQVAGGLAQGIGLALYEAVIQTDHGQLVTSTLMEYPMPSTAEVPPIAIEHIETPSPVTVGGFKGAGEAGTQAAPAAIAAAVADALAPLGASVDRIPLDPDTVLRLVQSLRDVELGAAIRFCSSVKARG